MDLSNENSELQNCIYNMNLFLLKCIDFYEK